MAFLFELAALVDLMSIGTLLAYSLVAVCVLILRYQPGSLSSPGQCEKMVDLSGEKTAMNDSDSGDEFACETVPLKEKFTMKLLFVPNCDFPTKTSGLIVYITTATISLVFTVLCCVLSVKMPSLVAGEPLWVTVCAVLAAVSIVCIAIIWRQPESRESLTFKVPFLPLLPLFSIFVNVYLMMQLDAGTWVRFAVWMTIGFLIYFAYGIRNSSVAQSSADKDKYEAALGAKTPIYLKEEPGTESSGA